MSEPGKPGPEPSPRGRAAKQVLAVAGALTLLLLGLAGAGVLPFGVALGIVIPVDLVIGAVVLAGLNTPLFMRLLGAAVGGVGLLMLATAALVFSIGVWRLIRPAGEAPEAPWALMIFPLVSVVLGGLMLFYASDLFRRAREGPDTPQPEFAVTPRTRLRAWVMLSVGGVLCLVAALTVVGGAIGLVRGDADEASSAAGSGVFLLALFGTMVRSGWRQLFGRREV